MGAATARRSRRSFARSCSVHGSTTAPMRKQAHIVNTHSGRLPISVITTSPRPIPCARNVPASAALRSLTSPKRPLAPGALARELHEREPRRGQPVKDSRAKFMAVFSR